MEFKSELLDAAKSNILVLEEKTKERPGVDEVQWNKDQTSCEVNNSLHQVGFCELWLLWVASVHREPVELGARDLPHACSC